MSWEIRLTARAAAFLRKNRISEKRIGELVALAIRNFYGERVAIDIKKLRGPWSRFYRIRKGELRIIVAFYFDARSALVEAIDRRGNVY